MIKLAQNQMNVKRMCFAICSRTGKFIIGPNLLLYFFFVKVHHTEGVLQFVLPRDVLEQHEQ